MLTILTRHKLNELIKEAEREAFMRAYVLGYRTAEADRKGKGVIAGSVDKQIDEILRQRGI